MILGMLDYKRKFENEEHSFPTPPPDRNELDKVLCDGCKRGCLAAVHWDAIEADMMRYKSYTFLEALASSTSLKDGRIILHPFDGGPCRS